MNVIIILSVIMLLLIIPYLYFVIRKSVEESSEDIIEPVESLNPSDTMVFESPKSEGQ